jgi:SOUL heme-binding protein
MRLARGVSTTSPACARTCGLHVDGDPRVLRGILTRAQAGALVTHRRKALLLLGVLLSLGGHAMAIEQPRFRVVHRLEDFEIREYAAQVVAETEVSGTRESAGNSGFRLLAGYIFGKNRGERKIAMTAPVTQAEGEKIAMTSPVTQAPSGRGEEGSRWVIQFTMPAAYSLETLPEPLDPAIRFRPIPARRVAALAYSETWAESRYLEHLARLQEAMRREGLQPRGEPVWARYDPPWIPWFLRRNEILIDLAD